MHSSQMLRASRYQVVWTKEIDKWGSRVRKHTVRLHLQLPALHKALHCLGSSLPRAKA